jgi:hypothetical protein
MGDWEAPAWHLEIAYACLPQMQKLHSVTHWLCTCSLFNRFCMTAIYETKPSFISLLPYMVLTLWICGQTCFNMHSDCVCVFLL